MSIDFNGTTSKLEHTTATGYNTATLTILVWALADGQGEGGFGRIFQCNETTNAGANSGNGFAFFHQNTASTLRFTQAAATAQGNWTFPATDAQWNAVGLSYDRSLAANDPIARVNFAPVTVTRVAGPSGAITGALSGYCIGNQTLQARTWDGAIQHLQFFNVILTANEMDAALRVPGSIRRGLVSHWPMWHAGYTVDLVNTSFQPTATGLADRNGCPAAIWGSRARGWRGLGAAAAPSGWGPLLGGERNQLVVA